MLKEFLNQRKNSITDKWFDLIMDSYPADTSEYLKKEKDRFNNPVGHTIHENMNFIFDGLLDGDSDERISTCLDNIIRIRSIQDFSPREAVAFIFQLKKIIRAELEDQRTVGGIIDEFPEFERKIDELALLAFQIYVKCREDLFEIRTRELRSRSNRLMQMVSAKEGTVRGEHSK